MSLKKYSFQQDFINCIINYLNTEAPQSIKDDITANINIQPNTTYTINNICDILVKISTKKYGRHKLPLSILTFLGLSTYSSYTLYSIKYLVKKQINTINDEHFIKTYVVIGYDVPISIKELTVVI